LTGSNYHTKALNIKLEISFMEQRESIETYTQAIAIYKTALKFAPNDFNTNKRLGMANEKLSELQLEQKQYKQAIKALKQARAAYEIAFSQTPDDSLNISYLGTLIERLAELQSSQKQYAQAFDSYQQALTRYDTAIKLTPNDYCNHALKAGALTSVADLQVMLSQYTQAVENFERSVACYDTSLALNRFKAVEFDKARTLQKLGNCLQQLSRNSEALESYQAAMKVFSQLPPGDKHTRSLTQQIEKLRSQD
jgi:tetratricopeptide (TPR) repeat protein